MNIKQASTNKNQIDLTKKFAGKGYKICYVKTLAETVKDGGYEKTRAFYKSLSFYTLEIIDSYTGWDKGNPCQILAAALPLAS